MAAQYDIWYRVHAQKFGWLGWAKNGEEAGTDGQSLRLEGIQILLVSKNTSAPKSVAKPFIKSPEDILKSVNTSSGSASISTFGNFKLSSGARQALQNGINTAQASGHHAGFIMVDLGTGKGVQYGCDRTFFSMSTMKGPYVISLVAHNPGAIRANMGTVRSILVYSDNDAYASLWNRYGTGSMRNWMTRAGVNTSRANTKYTYITPRELGKLWILNFQYYNRGELGDTLGALSESPNFSPIHDRLGRKYTTRTKAGWYYRHAGLMNVNDAGIVYATSGPYMICIMTDWPAEDKARLYGIIDALERVHNEM
ncbi:MAG: serine hydrolase [Eubacterium sp.]|nr:serine hydrolase [Eubacterium sp.]